MAIVTRTGKGSALTYAELDNNFTELNTTATGAIPKSIVDAKGDIIAASADNTPIKVTVGADDTILVADSGETAGIKWTDGKASYIPTVAAQSGSITSYTSAATYVRIGKLVTVFFDVAISNAGTGTGALIISLPTASAVNGSGVAREYATTGVMCYVDLNTAGSCTLRKYDNTSMITTGHTFNGMFTFLE